MVRSLDVRTLATGLLAIATTFAVFSLDRAKAQDPVHDWTGFYFGGQAGIAGGEDHFVFPGFTNRVNAEGFIGGGHVGYNWQTPDNLVFGIVGDVNYSDIDGRSSFGSTTNTVDVDLTASVRAKFGYAWEDYLVYGTTGLAIADLDYTNQFGASPTLSKGDTALGFTVGGGFEIAFNEWVSGLIEYRYTSYRTDGRPAITVGNFNFAGFSQQLETHQVQVGVSVNLSKLIHGGN